MSVFGIRIKQIGFAMMCVVGASQFVGCKGETDVASAKQSGNKSIELSAATNSSTIGSEDVEQQGILAKLKAVRPDFEISDVEPTQVNGIYKAQIKRGPIIYITEDGGHFFAGDFFEVSSEGLINIAERDLAADRAEQLAAIPDEELIVFGTENKKTHLYVFTDADCYYCQKLHNEMADINAKGIEIRYLAYPRAGIGSPSYNKIASAWCAKDPNEAMTQIKSGKSIPENVCNGNPVAMQYDLGARLGVTGTPALVTADGVLMPGYLPADKLAERMGL